MAIKKTKIQIKSRGGGVLFEYEAEDNTVRKTVEKAREEDANLLRGANLRGADLRGADLYDANLRDADLRDADLHGANLYDADLHGADLRDDTLVGAWLDYGDSDAPGEDGHAERVKSGINDFEERNGLRVTKHQVVECVYVSDTLWRWGIRILGIEKIAFKAEDEGAKEAAKDGQEGTKGSTGILREFEEVWDRDYAGKFRAAVLLVVDEKGDALRIIRGKAHELVKASTKLMDGILEGLEKT